MDGDLAELINDVDKWDVADEQLERRESCMAMPAVETGGRTQMVFRRCRRSYEKKRRSARHSCRA
jgi:hypothetical protein